MTLVGAFRCRSEGVVLFADREENDGLVKRSIDKIHRINVLPDWDIFVAGAGPTDIVLKTIIAFGKDLKKAQKDKKATDVLDATTILERSLKATYKRYVKADNDDIGLIIVVGFSTTTRPPLLYRTQGSTLAPVMPYAVAGTGYVIANYLANSLYHWDLSTNVLIDLAAFILRETEEATAGVGSGADMVVIHDGDKGRREFDSNAIKERQTKLPALKELLWPHLVG